MSSSELPVVDHFNSDKVGEIWKVEYETIAAAAGLWIRKQSIKPASDDRFRICLVLIDVQNTFCIPGFELFVGGESGTGAVDDNRRLCEFIYRNLSVITQICPTMDTHQAIQIFHSIFFVDAAGQHPPPYTQISHQDIDAGVWQFNPDLANILNVDITYARQFLDHYTSQLKASGKYDLTIWPYHAMLGGIGHALVPAVEEAIFFHSIARRSQPDLQLKGSHPFTEHYSVLSPEIRTGPDGKTIAGKNEQLIQKLSRYNAVIVAGQAKSHCVAWTVDDLLKELMLRDKQLVEKVYLLEDCASPVVIPDVVDFTEPADAAYQRFADAGMHVVRSSDPIHTWPGIKLDFP